MDEPRASNDPQNRSRVNGNTNKRYSEKNSGHKYSFEKETFIDKSKANSYIRQISEDFKNEIITKQEHDKYISQILSKMQRNKDTNETDSSLKKEDVSKAIYDSSNNTSKQVTTENVKDVRNEDNKDTKPDSKEHNLGNNYKEEPGFFDTTFKLIKKSDIFRLIAFVGFAIFLLTFLARGEVNKVPNSALLIVVVGVIILILLRTNGDKNVYK